MTPLEEAAKQISDFLGDRRKVRVQREDNAIYHREYTESTVEYTAYWTDNSGETQFEDATSLAGLVDLVRAKHNATNAKDDHPELSAAN